MALGKPWMWGCSPMQSGLEKATMPGQSIGLKRAEEATKLGTSKRHLSPPPW